MTYNISPLSNLFQCKKFLTLLFQKQFITKQTHIFIYSVVTICIQGPDTESSDFELLDLMHRNRKTTERKTFFDQGQNKTRSASVEVEVEADFCKG